MGLEQQIDEMWESGSLDPAVIEEVVALLDAGAIRVAEPAAGGWTVNEWVKKAILLYFRVRKVEPMDIGGLHFLDKIPVKTDYADRGVRVVPPGVARYGSFLSEGCVLMPGYVNIGAWVGPRTMVDTWATVGSCAQIGSDVHLAGGVGIGGVLDGQRRARLAVDRQGIGAEPSEGLEVLVGEGLLEPVERGVDLPGVVPQGVVLLLAPRGERGHAAVLLHLRDAVARPRACQGRQLPAASAAISVGLRILV